MYKRAVVCCLLMLLAAMPVFAQRITGSISGNVTDAQGAVVAGAKVTIANPETGYKLELKTGSDGLFNAPDLSPANYRVSVEAAGFNTYRTTATVRVGIETPVHAIVQVGAASVEIEVQGAAVAVDTAKSTVQGVITADRITDIPLNGRNFLDLAQQEPGVQTVDGGDFDPTKYQMTGVSVGGRSGRVTRIQVDGVDITDETVGTTVANISNESIQEFGISQSGLDPSTDLTSSGAVNVITKSGTNTIHGDGFINFRDSALAADQRIQKDGEKPPFRRKIFGGSLGGPLVKDKLFWHVSYEENQTRAVKFTATPFPQFNGVYKSPMDEQMGGARLDWNINQKAKMFYRFNHDWNRGIAGNGDTYLSAFGNLNNTNMHVVGADVFTGNWTHQFRYSYLNFNNFIQDANAAAGAPATLDPNGQPVLINIQYYLYVGPHLNAPQNTFQDNNQIKYDGAFIHGKHALRMGAELNKISEGGFASFFGLAPRMRARINAYNPAGTYPGGPDNPLNYNLRSITFGNGLGCGSEKPGFGRNCGAFYNDRVGFYFQDTWKATNNLTFNGGLRYSWNSATANHDLARTELIGAFDPTLAGYPKRPHNFGPQAGFAWNVRGDGKTVIRGSAGVFYETNIINNLLFDRAVNLPPGLGNDTPVLDNYLTGTPFLLNPATGAVMFDFTDCFGKPMGDCISRVTTAQAAYQAVTAQLAANWPPPGVPPLFNQTRDTGGSLVDTNYKTPYGIQMNIGVQREIRNGLVLSADYVRNRGVHFNLTRDRNRLGAANTLYLPAAQSAIAATLADYECSDIDCVIAAGGSISDFANNGLGSGNGIDHPFEGATWGMAFGGMNRAYRGMGVIESNGLSLYQALQLRLNGKLPNLGPFKNTTTNVTYAWGSYQSTGLDQDFLTTAVYNDNPTAFFGTTDMDRRHILGISFVTDLPFKFRFSTTSAIRSSLSDNMFLSTYTSGADEIFYTDLDGDGITGDPLPGTNRGAFGRKVKADNINSYINKFNSAYAGQFTPAGQALVDAGLFTADQLKALGAVIQPVQLAPTNQRNEPNFVTTDLRLSRPIKITERFTIEPQMEIFNVFNFANYKWMQSNFLDGSVGSPNGTPAGALPIDAGMPRMGAGSGSFAAGIPRAFQFNLRINF